MPVKSSSVQRAVGVYLGGTVQGDAADWVEDLELRQVLDEEYPLARIVDRLDFDLDPGVDPGVGHLDMRSGLG